MVVYTSSPEETAQLAGQLGEKILASGKGLFIAFYGDMGAGKTAFISALKSALGCGGEAGSPTFALMNLYPGRLPVYHFDLYRIDADEVYRLGFDEQFFDDSAVRCVEWCERMDNSDLPPERLEIKIIKLDGSKRCFSFRPIGLDWEEEFL